MDSKVILVIVLAVACSSVAAISVVSICFWVYHVRSKRKAYTDTSSPETLGNCFWVSIFSLPVAFSSCDSIYSNVLTFLLIFECSVDLWGL